MGNQQKQNLPQLSRKAILDHLSAPDYQPLRTNKLRSALNISNQQSDEFSHLLNELERDGEIVFLKRKGVALAESADLVRGSIRFTRSGAAIVSATASDREIFVPSNATGTAFPGDQVLVRIDRHQERGPGKTNLEGTVIRVVEAKARTVVGTLKKMRKVYYVKPMKSSLTHDIIVPDPAGAELGDRVLVRVAAWDEPNVSPEGDIIEVIGPADDASLDTLAVCRSYELPDNFPAPAVRQAESAAITDQSIEGRLDLRSRFIFTIDPATARDFDDAISLNRAKGGKWRLGVHIADVSHFVKPGTPLDDAAIKRATSTYFPDKVVPMLPEQLSNGLCSLRPDEDRLAFSVFITLDDDGNVHRTRFGDSVIRSRLRLTYEQAFDILEAPQDDPPHGVRPSISGKIKQIHKLAQAVRRKRMEKGALNMDLPEVKFILGDDGHIEDVEPVEHDISHQLIEECMLMANEAVCRELSKRKVPLLHRIHEEPDPEKLAELEEMFLAFGWHVGNLTQRRNMMRLLEQISKRPEAEAMYTSVLRTLKRAMYSAECVGHYGLAKEYYTHFTSPIRRYPDLVVHRILRAVLQGEQSPYDKKQLTELGAHCSEREQVSTEAERELVDLKKVRFFSEQIETGNIREYDAIVTDVRNFGLFVHLPKVQAYGLIHVSELSQDFFDFNPVGKELKGRRTGQLFRVGSTARVIIAKIDMDKRQLDFQIVEDDQAKNKKSKNRRKKRRQ